MKNWPTHTYTHMHTPKKKTHTHTQTHTYYYNQNQILETQLNEKKHINKKTKENEEVIEVIKKKTRKLAIKMIKRNRM